MKAEYGKYYELNNDKSYFSVDLQRMVRFPWKVAVQSDSSSGPFNEAHFGYLIEIGLVHDSITNNEIEFSDEDILSEYKFRKL